MIKVRPDCVSFQGYNEETPLHQAAQYGQVEAVKLILGNEHGEQLVNLP